MWKYHKLNSNLFLIYSINPLKTANSLLKVIFHLPLRKILKFKYKMIRLMNLKLHNKNYNFTLNRL